MRRLVIGKEIAFFYGARHIKVCVWGGIMKSTGLWLQLDWNHQQTSVWVCHCKLNIPSERKQGYLNRIEYTRKAKCKLYTGGVMNLDIIDLMPCPDCRKQQSVLPLSDSAIERRTQMSCFVQMIIVVFPEILVLWCKKSLKTTGKAFFRHGIIAGFIQWLKWHHSDMSHFSFNVPHSFTVITLTCVIFYFI